MHSYKLSCNFVIYMRGDFFYKRLGDCVFISRKRRFMSQEELSQRASLDRTYLSRIEQGKVNPSIRILHKIARVLKITISVLLKGL